MPTGDPRVWLGPSLQAVDAEAIYLPPEATQPPIYMPQAKFKGAATATPWYMHGTRVERMISAIQPRPKLELIMVDSGAFDNVCPPSYAPQAKIVP